MEAATDLRTAKQLLERVAFSNAFIGSQRRVSVWVMIILLCARPGLRHRTVLPAVGGLLSGHLAATAVVAAGVGALVAGAPLVLTVLTVAGSAYLAGLGIGMLRRPSIPQAGQELGSGSWVRQALKGAGISGLNSKLFLLFLAPVPAWCCAPGRPPPGP